MLSEDVGKALPAFQFLKSLGDFFPNTEIAYTIMLTVPVTVEKGERSFSKLKMVKNCLRTTVAQERLGGLAVLPIEEDDIDYSNLFAEFAAIKSRKVVFM
jgi:hypothetical protein